MLVIFANAIEYYKEGTQEFVQQGGTRLELEHSLVALSKWEEIHEVPFLSKKDKTPEQLTSFVECMTLTPNPPAGIFEKLSERNINDIYAYMNRKMTATWFTEHGPKQTRGEVVTAELIYYWMTLYNIPWEAQHWHLNKLFTLIRVCGEKQQKPKKMSRQEQARQRHQLNAQRKAQMGTSG